MIGGEEEEREGKDLLKIKGSRINKAPWQFPAGKWKINLVYIEMRIELNTGCS